MKRTISRMGPSTLVVSLPSKWAKEQQLQQGQEIEVLEEGPRLVLNCNGHAPSRVIVQLDFLLEKVKGESTRYKLIRSIISSLYYDGIEEILVRFKDTSMLGHITRVVHDLIGYELVEQNTNTCIIKNVAVGLAEEIPALERRLFHQFSYTLKAVAQSLEQNKDLAELPYLKNSIQKNVDFVIRTYHLSKQYAEKEKQARVRIIRTLKTGMNALFYAYDYLVSSRVKLSKPGQAYLQEIVKYFDFFQRYYFSQEEALSEHVTYQSLKDALVFQKGYELLQSAPRAELPALYHLLNVPRWIWESHREILTVHLQP